MTLRLVTIAMLVGSVALAQTKPSSRPGGEIVPPARRDVPGQRITISQGELFIPDFAKRGEQIDVVIWFLGATWCIEQVFYDADRDAAILSVNAQTLKAGFADSAAFDSLLAEVHRAAGARVGKVVLGSFSGGYTAVRDLLRHEQIAKRVSDVVLADSLYAPKQNGVVDDAAMKPFLDFARRARDGECRFIYSQLCPPLEEHRGNTTTLTAMYLIDKLGLERTPGQGKSSRGAVILYRAERGGCRIFGYAGMTNQDHFDHLYGAADLFRMTSLNAKDAP